MLFSILLLLFSLLSLAAGGVILLFCRKESLLPSWEKLPRAKYAGIVLLALAVFWCIPNIQPILEPGSSLLKWLYPAAIVAVILCAVFLDYLFARGFAALLILIAHWFLKESFAAHVYPVSILLALCLFTLGIGGILIGAKPYWMRDWIRMLFRRPAIRYLSAAFLFLLALSGTAVSICSMILGQGGLP